MWLFMYRVLLGLSMMLVLVNCAQPGSPTGGPRDDTPPEVASTYPAPKSLRYDDLTVKFVFSEAIKKPTYDKEIFISPFTKRPDISLSDNGKRLTLKFEEALRPQTTYVITLNDIQDQNEGNKMANSYTLAFSTGDQLDSMSIVGDIVSPVIGEQVKGMTVLLFDADSIQDNDFLRKRPAYLAKADEQGKFTFEYLRKAPYKILAIANAQNTNTYSGGLEQVAMPKDTVLIFPEDNVALDSLQALLTDSLGIDTIDTLPSPPPIEERADSILLDSLALDSILIDSSLVDTVGLDSGQVEAVIPIDSSTILQVRLYAFTPDPFYPLVNDADWIADSTFVLGFNKRLRLERVRMWLTDTLGQDSFPIDHYSFRVNKEKKAQLFVHMNRPQPLYSQLHIEGLTDSMYRRLDTVIQVKPDRIRSLEVPTLSLLGLDLEVPGWEVFTPRLYRPGKALFLLTDTSLTQPDTLTFARKDSGFRFYVAPAPPPDTVVPYLLKMGGAWADPVDTIFSDSTFIFPVSWFDPEAYGLMTGRVVLDSPFAPPIVMHLLNDKKEIVRTVTDTTFAFNLLKPGTYTATIILDTDSSGHWTTGDITTQTFPEQIFRSKEQLTIRANWELLDQAVRVSLSPVTVQDTSVADTASPRTGFFGQPGLRE